jgi:hypothetical protein
MDNDTTAEIPNKPGLWIEYTDEAGEDGFARWGEASVTTEQIDKILAFATELLGGCDTFG